MFGTRSHERLLPAVVLLCAAPAAAAESDYTTIFHGRMEERDLIAVSIQDEDEVEELTDLTAQPGCTILVYVDYKRVSSTEPVAVYVDGNVTLRYDDPSRVDEHPTIGHFISAAAEAGPKILHATCRDGTRSPTSGATQITRLVSSWHGCAKHGGLDRIYYSASRDEAAIVASICKDFRLVSGSGDRCGRPADVLARVRNKDY